MIYNNGLDALARIETADMRWMLLDSGYTFDADHDTVSALTPGTNEISVTGYTRQNLTGATRTVDDATDRIDYSGDDPDFGTLATGQTIAALVLYEHVTDDTDSVPVAYYDLTPLDTAAVDPCVITFTDGLLAWVDEV